MATCDFFSPLCLSLRGINNGVRCYLCKGMNALLFFFKGSFLSVSYRT